LKVCAIEALDWSHNGRPTCDACVPGQIAGSKFYTVRETGAMVERFHHPLGVVCLLFLEETFNTDRVAREA
jgi:hypothetical protein